MEATPAGECPLDRDVRNRNGPGDRTGGRCPRRPVPRRSPHVLGPRVVPPPALLGPVGADVPRHLVTRRGAVVGYRLDRPANGRGVGGGRGGGPDLPAAPRRWFAHLAHGDRRRGARWIWRRRLGTDRSVRIDSPSPPGAER